MARLKTFSDASTGMPPEATCSWSFQTILFLQKVNSAFPHVQTLTHKLQAGYVECKCGEWVCSMCVVQPWLNALEGERGLAMAWQSTTAIAYLLKWPVAMPLQNKHKAHKMSCITIIIT